MSRACIGEPVSWLRLERYYLGELDAAERGRIAEHLASCAACAACFAEMGRNDEPALRPLDVSTLSRPVPTAPRSSRASIARRVAGVVGGLSMAAAILFAVVQGMGPGGSGVLSGDGTHSKGGAVTLTLVRDDSTQITESRGVFRDGDRFKVLVTCPASLRASFDVVVFDASGASFPLAAGEVVACGNDVPIPGAFELTGSGDETVCLVWSEAPLDRGALSKGEATLGERSACKHLAPAPR